VQGNATCWAVGVGVGARYYTSIGPLRLDIALPTYRRPATIASRSTLASARHSDASRLAHYLLDRRLGAAFCRGARGRAPDCGQYLRGRIWLEHVTARVTSGHVRISGLAGSFPTAIDLQQLQLSDAHGTWLTAQRVALHWSPLALLARHITVENLIVGRLAIERAPVSEPKKHSSTRLPQIDLGRLSIGALELSPQLTGLRATLAVQGSAHLISLENAAARITARRTDGEGGDYELTLRFDPARMDASLKLDEPAVARSLTCCITRIWARSRS